ncbi:MAG: CTP synthase, partial [Chloroflexi bacterium]|nr:CTP synthase [Chloroflexota bacterium]
GGTIGDIESLPLLEALRQMRKDAGPENSAYIHLTWLPYIGATGELKTKPTQHSVRELRSIGISPQIIVTRADHPVDSELRDKIALFCDVDEEAVIPLVTSDVMYDVPLVLEEAGIAEYLLEKLNLKPRKKPELKKWSRIVEIARREKETVKVALVGKYVELHDAYLSVREALKHAGIHLGVGVEIEWIHSAELEKGKTKEELWQKVKAADAVLVPGGFGSRGIEGKIMAAKYARENKVPYLGLCLGMQLMVVEFGRKILNDESVNSTEFDHSTSHPVIDLMLEQRDITDKGATMRLGVYPCVMTEGSIAANAYKKEVVDERHRHRFEFNNAYREIYEEAGMRFSGISPDGKLVEIAEMVDHPYMVATQFHPEFLSSPTQAHPLFLEFIRATCEKAGIEWKEDKKL